MWELHHTADVLCVISARPPGCRIMTYLLPHTVQELAISEASSQRGRPHLTSHSEGEEERVEVDEQQEKGRGRTREERGHI